MKKNKILAVLLSVVMLLSVIPAFSLNATAAAVGQIVNGDFSSYESYTGSSNQTAYKAEGWDVRDWGITLGVSGQSGKGAQISKHSSHKDACELTQVVPVNTNATYTFSFYSMYRSSWYNGTRCFTYSLDLGTTASDFSTVVVNKGAPSTGYGWQQTTYTVNTGSNKYLRIRFFATGSGSHDSFLDTVALATTNAGDAGTHAKPTLKSFGTEKNRPSGGGTNVNDPAACTNNVIKQPGFESTTNAQWNTDSFLKQGVSIETDASIAHSGSKYLKYYHGSVAYTEWPMFEFTCPTAGEYVFSVWVRTPHLSANNKGAASIGIINPDTGKFLTYGNAGGSYDGHYSNTETQLRSTATDDNWHLRSVTFYVGADNSNVKIGMYGLSSTMYVDDISVHLLSKGEKYVGNQTGTLSASTSVDKKFCASEHNLIPDCNMTGNLAANFWKQSSGWNNGFLSFGKDASTSDHGNSLCYAGTNPGSNKLYNYIKFIYVEPNTNYTVSFDYRVAAAGNQVMFIDNNIESPQVFHTPSLGSVSNSWKTYAFTFNSGNYNRIGIVFRDHASAKTYFDDFRFFKTSDGIAEEPEEEVYPTLKHEEGRKSQMDPQLNSEGEPVYGLAFRFNLKVTGATKNENYIGDLTAATVDAFEDGNQWKLVKMGAVVTNQESIGTDEAAFVLEKTGAHGVAGTIDINAEKLYDISGGKVYYAVRIINIPDSNKGTMIYARPYYIFEYQDKQITVYGDICNDSAVGIPDINDGWMEWD